MLQQKRNKTKNNEIFINKKLDRFQPFIEIVLEITKRIKTKSFFTLTKQISEKILLKFIVRFLVEYNNRTNLD